MSTRAYAVEPFLDEAERARALAIDARRSRRTPTPTTSRATAGSRSSTACPVSVHAAAGAAYPHEPLEDGDEIAVGSIALRTLHTPGHRPEHCCFLAGDALLTGDSLFVGAAARPDLAVDAREGAEGLFHSLHRLLELPDDVRVFPGHVAGSLCGDGHEPKSAPRRSATSGASTRRSRSPPSRSSSPSRPRSRRRGRRTWSGSSSSTAARSSGRRRPLRLDGHRDGDPCSTFATATTSPPARPGRGERPGLRIVVRRRRPVSSSRGVHVVLHGESPEQAERAAAQLLPWASSSSPATSSAEATETLEPVELDELERLVADGAVDVIDVREKDERDAGYIPGSRNIPYRVIGAFGRRSSAWPARSLPSARRGRARRSPRACWSRAGLKARPVLARRHPRVGGAAATRRSSSAAAAQAGPSRAPRTADVAGPPTERQGSRARPLLGSLGAAALRASRSPPPSAEACLSARCDLGYASRRLSNSPNSSSRGRLRQRGFGAARAQRGPLAPCPAVRHDRGVGRVVEEALRVPATPRTPQPIAARPRVTPIPRQP